jgi:hypothetical protein
MKVSKRVCNVKSSNIKPYLLILIAGVLFFGVTKHSDAHKPITSKYDYNRDVFPLLREHCARCHVEGGPAPMSLMTYKEAVPWAESIRDEVTAGRMPPWPIDPTSPAVQGEHPIGSHDLNTIVVWASGGTPEGNPDTKLPAVTSSAQWKLGAPDLKIPMDVEHTVAPGTIEQTADLSLPTNLTDTRWIKAVDLLPGNASIVRNAVIEIENGPVLALWEPGNDTIAAPSGTGFRLAPGSKIHLQIHYKKHFDQEQNAVSDKSTIGLYFTDPPPSGHELQTLVIELSQAHKLANAMRIVALRPILDRAYESVHIDAVTPSGTHVPLIHLQGPRPQWPRRYWLQEPVELTSGSQINVTLKPLSDYSDEPKPAKQLQLQIALDYVPQ